MKRPQRAQTLERSSKSSGFSLLGRLLSLLALLLSAISGGSLLLDTVQFFDHESASDSVWKRNDKQVKFEVLGGKEI